MGKNQNSKEYLSTTPKWDRTRFDRSTRGSYKVLYFVVPLFVIISGMIMYGKICSVVFPGKIAIAIANEMRQVNQMTFNVDCFKREPTSSLFSGQKLIAIFYSSANNENVVCNFEKNATKLGWKKISKGNYSKNDMYMKFSFAEDKDYKKIKNMEYQEIPYLTGKTIWKVQIGEK